MNATKDRGQLFIKVSPQDHTRIKIAAAITGVSMQRWCKSALLRKLVGDDKREMVSDQKEGDFL